MVSILCGLGGMVGWGVYDFFAGLYSRSVGPFSTFFWSQLSGSIFLVFLVPAFYLSPEYTLGTMVFLVLAAFFYTAGYLLFMRGLQIGDISIVAAVINVWAVFTIFNSYVFMDQRLKALQWAGVAMIITGAVLTSLDLTAIRKGAYTVSRGVKEALFGSFFFGTFWNFSEVISEDIGWLPATLLVKGGIVLFLSAVIFFFLKKNGTSKVSLKVAGGISLIGVIESGAVAVVNYGLSVGDAILVSPIASALSVVTIVLAIVILKERPAWNQALGILTVIAGIVLTGV